MATRPQTLVERYALAPEAIEALSLERVRAALPQLAEWPLQQRAVAERVIYAGGDPTLLPLLRFHPDAMAAGVAALRRGAAVVVDVRMVEAALNRAHLAALSCSVHCAIDALEVAAAAQAEQLPRAVVAIRSLAPQLAGGIAIIGNAPTALLSLLDLIDAGQAAPALIIGMPVGLVAAAEAKAELMARSVPYIAIEGTRGGSPLAAAAANALLALAVAGREA